MKQFEATTKLNMKLLLLLFVFFYIILQNAFKCATIVTRETIPIMFVVSFFFIIQKCIYLLIKFELVFFNIAMSKIY